jgi:hypothetical protein
MIQNVFSTKMLYVGVLIIDQVKSYSSSKFIRLGGYFLWYWSFYGNDSLRLPRTTDDGQITDRLRLWYMTSSQSMPNKMQFSGGPLKIIPIEKYAPYCLKKGTGRNPPSVFNQKLYKVKVLHFRMLKIAIHFLE